MVTIPGHNYRRGGSSPPSTFVIFMVAIIIMLGIYSWTLNSENKSLKSSMLHTYTKLKQVANAKVNAEKRNTVLSNKMVHMEEERDSAKDTMDQEKTARKDCENSLSQKDQNVDDVNLKLKRILDEIYPDRNKPNPDDENLVKKVSDMDVTNAVEEIKNRKMAMASLRQDYMMLQNKYSSLDKDFVDHKHKLEKCESKKGKEVRKVNADLNPALNEVDEDEKKIVSGKEGTSDVVQTTPAATTRAATTLPTKGPRRKPILKKRKHSALGGQKGTLHAKLRRSQGDTRTVVANKDMKPTMVVVGRDDKSSSASSGTLPPAVSTPGKSENQAPSLAAGKDVEGKLGRKHILEQMRQKEKKLQDNQENKNNEESPEMEEENAIKEEHEGEPETANDDVAEGG